MSNVELKYRILCHQCEKTLDSRKAINSHGRCICPECFNEEYNRKRN